jgi:hypothetical protein
MRGSCLCGAVAFEITGALPDLYQCHCSLCRKQSGTASNAATIVQASQLMWMRGRDGIKSWIKNTGFRSDFCAECGSPVPNPLRNKPYYWVPAGLLDSVETSAITVHLHIGSKANWDHGGATGTKYDEMPSLEHLLEAIERRLDT